MIKEIVIESTKFEEVITITSNEGIDIYDGVIHEIIKLCDKKSEDIESDRDSDIDSESDSDSESEIEIILKHRYTSGCYCDSCNVHRSQAEINYHTNLND